MANAGTVYEEEPTSIPKPQSGKPIHQENTNTPPAETSGNGGSEGGTETETSGVSPGSEGSDDGGTSAGQGSSSGNGGSPNAGNSGGVGQGSPGTGSQEGASAPVENASTQSDDNGGSSSPLVPILIAVAVLAAISVGVVVMRQKNQRRDADGSMSPKAS